MTVEKFSAAEIFSESTEAYVLPKKPNDLWYRYLMRPQNFLYIENFYKIHKFFE